MTEKLRKADLNSFYQGATELSGIFSYKAPKLPKLRISLTAENKQV